MNHGPFIDDSLTSLLVIFVRSVQSRIDLLVNQQLVEGLRGPRNASPCELGLGLVEGLCADLSAEVEKARIAAASNPLAARETTEHFCYLLASLADEMLLTSLKTQLPPRFNGGVEYMMFGTRNAGEQIFIRIEALLAKRSYLDLGLAAAYLLSLSLGFRGQYFLQSGHEVLMRNHKELLSFATLPPPQQPLATRLRNEVLPAGDAPALASARRFRWLVWAILAIWLGAVIAVELLWRRETAPLRELRGHPASRESAS